MVQPGESATNETQTVSAKPEKKHKKTKTPKTTEASHLAKEAGLEPIVSPPLPISTDKEAQLQALLAKYKADLVTAGQYQTERAKILAGP
jgi:hypothetical protein